MQRRRPTTGSFACRDSLRGFSLIEAIVTLTVISILVAMAVPSYQRALEQSRADIAAANLRAIWAAERLYWLEYQSFTNDLAGLRTMGLLEQEIVLATNGFTYSVTSAESNSFRAVATRTGSAAWTGEYAIDETGAISGAVEASGQPQLTPGFQ